MSQLLSIFDATNDNKERWRRRLPTWYAAVQLPGVSGVDRPPVSKHVTPDMRQFFEADLDIWPFQLKIGIPLTRALGNVYTNFDFLRFFLFSSYEAVSDRRTNRRTDRRSSKTRTAADRKAT